MRQHQIPADPAGAAVSLSLGCRSQRNLLLILEARAVIKMGHCDFSLVVIGNSEHTLTGASRGNF